MVRTTPTYDRAETGSKIKQPIARRAVEARHASPMSVLDLHVTYLRDTLFFVCHDFMWRNMETQNITLSLPRDVLLKIKLIAVQRQTSVSNLLTQALVHLVQQEEAYAHAQRRHMQQLDHAFDLGTRGKLKTKRDEIHERR